MAKPKTKTTKRVAKNAVKPGKTRGLLVVGAFLAILGGGAVIYASIQNRPVDQPMAPLYAVSSAEHRSAKSHLSELEVRADNYAPPTRYDSKSMPSWNDGDKNGCKTRDDILARDLVKTEFKAGDKCKIVSGELFDYYIGETILFDTNVSGGGIDVDHIVAKGDAWNSGGYRWDMVEWTGFANDPEELIAVSASINRQKGDKNAAQWLPPNEEFQCRYVVNQLNIKYKYALSVTDSEKMTMTNILRDNCIIKN